MELGSIYHTEAAVFLARVFLGLLFFFQGYDAIFNVKVPNIINAYKYQFSQKGIPMFLTAWGAWFTSYVELIGGLLLLLGFFKYLALYLLGLNLIIASIGFGITNAMWDMKFVFPRLVLLIFLLIIPSQWDIASFDNLISTLIYK